MFSPGDLAHPHELMSKCRKRVFGADELGLKLRRFPMSQMPKIDEIIPPLVRLFPDAPPSKPRDYDSEGAQHRERECREAEPEEPFLRGAFKR